MKILLVFSILICSIEAYALKYDLSNFNPYEHINKCKAGGTVFMSDYYNVVHLYKDFAKVHTQCKKLETKISGNLDQSKAEIKINSTQLSEDEECPEVAAVAKKYLESNERVLSKLDSEKYNLNQLWCQY